MNENLMLEFEKKSKNDIIKYVNDKVIKVAASS
jgi:hypothetical protein